MQNPGVPEVTADRVRSRLGLKGEVKGFLSFLLLWEAWDPPNQEAEEVAVFGSDK